MGFPVIQLNYCGRISYLSHCIQFVSLQPHQSSTLSVTVGVRSVIGLLGIISYASFFLAIFQLHTYYGILMWGLSAEVNGILLIQKKHSWELCLRINHWIAFKPDENTNNYCESLCLPYTNIHKTNLHILPNKQEVHSLFTINRTVGIRGVFKLCGEIKLV